MPRADLQEWAATTVIDPIKLTPNKLTISGDLWDKGWLRTNPVAAQHLNRVLNIITSVLKDNTLDPSLNLSDVANTATARTNLGIDTSLYNEKSQNLNDVANKATARTNLDLYQRSLNLSDVPSASTARTNLGISDLDLLNKFYPVGSIYENKTNSANPSTYLGGGTWVAEGQGRVSIGAGTGTDINAVNQAFTAGTTGGEYLHTLTLAEMPSHTHNITVNANDGSGNKVADSDGGGANSTAATASAGSGTAHNIVQPYSVYYRWVRTA
jgi:hypothetical protein